MSYPPRNNTRDVYTMGDKRRQKVLDMGRSKSFGQVNVPDLKCLRKFKSGRNHITDYPLCKTQNHVFVCRSLNYREIPYLVYVSYIIPSE